MALNRNGLIVYLYLFDESKFVREANGLDKDEFERYRSKSIESALDRINTILHFGGNKLIIDAKRDRLVSVSLSTPEISVNNIKTIDPDYIKSLYDRTISNVDSGNYDSALT